MEQILDSCDYNKDYLSIRLIKAVYNDNLDEVRALVDDFWIDVNTWDDDGYTTIWYATQNRNIKMILLLLEFGADPTISSSDGLKPLDVAIQNNDIKLINFLHHVERLWHSISTKPKYFEDSDNSFSELCLPTFENKIESGHKIKNHHKTRSRSSASSKAIRSRCSKRETETFIEPFMIRKKQRSKSLKKKERKFANPKYDMILVHG